MDEETLRELGLSPGATNDQIAAAFKAKTAEAKAKIAAVEAKAESERLARIEAQSREASAEALRVEQAKLAAAREAEAKVLADHNIKVETFLAGCTDGVRGIYEELCYDGEGDQRKPNPKGLEQAQRLAKTSPGALKSSLAGPSTQVQGARQATATGTTTTTKGPVKYRFAGATQEIDLTRLTGVTPEMIAAQQAEMEARAAARGQRIND